MRFDPKVKPPPKIQNMTASLLPFCGNDWCVYVQVEAIFAFTCHVVVPRKILHCVLNTSWRLFGGLEVSVHGCTGFGFLNLRSPTGGWAKGMPRKTFTALSFNSETNPCIGPRGFLRKLDYHQLSKQL
ncbi:hypothetical protein CEXT_657221 [Caerostris extrusa]|uniref:Uncharacterized protein n=1 Tax=Caerostris extrusa TaxID=172846 RepID=A0AAV4UJ08_CAEEX|nr:hypothetical protein CEXT_657221 [Caerostris extrusa]